MPLVLKQGMDKAGLPAISFILHVLVQAASADAALLDMWQVFLNAAIKLI